ncbi:MAG: hypothetical protein IJP22_02795 [Clostridia bacterium]|nr:hypothetical protein [Clostridia bacterium]
MNFAKKFGKSFKALASILLCLCLIFTLSTVAFADEAITDNMQKIIDVINTIPKDPNLLTIEHKDIILQVEKDYEALSDDEKIAFPQETYNVLSAAKYGIMPIVLNDVASRIEALPEKITAKDAEAVKAIEEEFMLLDETAQSALSPKNTKKMQDAIEKIKNPGASDNNEQKGDSKGIEFNFETIIIIVLSVLVLINLVLFIIVVIRLFVKKKERIEDEDDEIEE